jgi:glutamate N-acetyltransferase/amino-acid N-acetyltransferase
MVPKGFLFSTVETAIKKPGRKDIALIVSQKEASIAGMFTTNKVKAAPVKLDMKKIRSGMAQAIVVNSGNANACTGEKGMQDSLEIVNRVAAGLMVKPSLVYICSTGVIGVPLPMGRIRQKISRLTLHLGRSTLKDVAKAIMTTDTFPKIVSRKIKIGRMTGTITGICKGAGMICPDMATMLCFIMTDIAVKQKTLDRTLRGAVSNSFNCITVDGDRSTNDTILIMANGMLGNQDITEKSTSYNQFNKALSDVTHQLSRMVVKDGEGATKFIEIEVRGAKNETDARKAAFAVANSNLVKTAIYGNDVNWGRIMAALGYAGITLKEERTDIYLGKIAILKKGIGTGREGKAREVMKRKEFSIVIDLNIGKAFVKVLTCDLTEDYVKINASYRT